MGLAREISEHLQGKGLGTMGTDLFRNELPDSPDDATSVQPYAAERPGRSKDRREAHYEVPRFQVIVRSKDAAAAEKRAYEIFRELDGLSGVLSGVEYLSVRALQSPFPLGRDESERERVVCNYEATKELSPP